MNRRIDYKCPHCGEVFAARKCRDSLIPTHDFPRPCRSVCPGSGQTPRSLADRRPLWKDDPDCQPSAGADIGEPVFNVPKAKPKRIGTMQEIDCETGEVVRETKNAGVLLGPPPDKCQECAVDHPHEHPHNQQSMYYQMQFHATHGRWPTWTDAMAHCPPDVKAAWRSQLIKLLRSKGQPLPDDLMESAAPGR